MHGGDSVSQQHYTDNTPTVAREYNGLQEQQQTHAGNNQHVETVSNYRYQRAPADDQDINSCLRPNCHKSPSLERQTARSTHSFHSQNHADYNSQAAGSKNQGLHSSMSQLALDDAVEPPESCGAISARSRDTMFTTNGHEQADGQSIYSKKRSNGSLHKLGSKLASLINHLIIASGSPKDYVI